jgi:hypothetical protein
MPTAIIRRTQVVIDKVQDEAIDYKKAYIQHQTGTGTPNYTGIYVAFTTVYGTPPVVAAYAGTPGKLTDIQVVRVRPGSFQWRGSPVGRGVWHALGFRAA